MKYLRKEKLFSRGEHRDLRFRILPEMAERIRLEVAFEIPSDLRFVGSAAGYFSRLAREHGFHESVWAENLPLALDEALTNAIRHGHDMDASKPVRISGLMKVGVLQIRIEDQGDGFDPEALPDPREGDSLHRPSGRGVFLIRNLCHEARYEMGGRRLTMTFYRDGDSSRP